MTSLLRFLTLTPSITFGVLRSEIFPWAFIYSIFIFSYNNIYLLYILIFGLFHAAASWFFYGHFNLFDFTVVWGSYLNIFLIYYAVLKAKESLIVKYFKTLRWVFFLIIGVGLLQSSPVGEYADSVIKTLVPRGQGFSMGDGRGVTLLSSEPSRAAVEFLFLYAVVRFFIAEQMTKLRLALHDMLFLFFVVFVLKSLTGIICSVIFLAACSRKYMYWFSIAGVALLAGLLSTSDRFTKTLLILSNSESFDLAWLYFIDVSGFRVPAVLSSYYSIFDSYIGYGAGNFVTSSTSALEYAGFTPDSIAYFRNRGGEFFSLRPPSFFANLILDFGIFGIGFIILFLKQTFKAATSGVYPILVIFLIVAFFSGSVGNPVPWICLAITLRLSAQNASRTSFIGVKH